MSDPVTPPGKAGQEASASRRRPSRRAGGDAKRGERHHPASDGVGGEAGQEGEGTRSSVGLAVFKSGARQKAEQAERERERLLRQIEQKKRACEVAEQAKQAAQRRLHSEGEPLRRSFFEIVRRIRGIFRELLDPNHLLGKRERVRLRRFYAEVQQHPAFSEEDHDSAADEAADGPEGEAEDEFDRGRAPGDRQTRASQPRGAGRARADGRVDAPEWEDEHPSAPQPAEARSAQLRAVYRRLAVALHPDKVQDAEQARKLTELMKQVTAAYAASDLATLLRLARTWLATPADSGDGSEVGEERWRKLLREQTSANQELRRQLRQLSEALKALKEPILELMDRTGRRRATLPEQVEYLLLQMKDEVREVQDLLGRLVAYQKGALSLDALTRAGAADRSGPSEDELLEQIAQVMFEASLRRGAARERSPRRR